MSLTAIEEAGVRAIEGQPGHALMAVEKDVDQVLEACFSEDVFDVLLYAENLTPAFFDLSSREAGGILQKLRTYNVRLAVVHPPERGPFSSRFGELLAEEHRGRHFRVVDTREAGRAWLTAGAR